MNRKQRELTVYTILGILTLIMLIGTGITIETLLMFLSIFVLAPGMFILTIYLIETWIEKGE